MEQDYLNIIELLSKGNYLTSSQIAEILKVSSKTIRNRINELKDICVLYDIEIESKPRYGYRLVEKKEKGLSCLIDFISNQNQSFPNNNEERVDYVLLYLLNRKEYVKLDDLADILCVSRPTLQPVIKEVESVLNEYNLILERKPNYGICIKGMEFDFRRCLGQCIKNEYLKHKFSNSEEDEFEKLTAMIMDLMELHHIYLAETAYEDLIIQIYVGMRRFRAGFEINEVNIPEEKKHRHEYDVANELANQIQSWQNLIYSHEEIMYIVVYIMGIRRYGQSNFAENFVVREELDSLVYKMLESIYEEYKIEFRNNFNLRMYLNQHMCPFDIRIRYNIKVKNEMKKVIMEKYPFCYNVSRFGCRVLENYYNRSVSSDEIAYFALLFAVALEQNPTRIEKSDILIVCSMGRGSSQLLKHRYQREFSDYISKIDLCGIQQLKTYDFSRVNYVFTTVPIIQKIPVPIINVGQFLETEDVVKVKKVLTKGKSEFLKKYFKENQFLVDVKGNTKEEILKNICDVVYSQQDVPDSFYMAVLEREEVAQTDFGNLVAIPHPYKLVTKHTFVYVAILEKEIMWGKNMVQLVILSSISDEMDPTLQQFYEVLSSFMCQSEMVREVIEGRNFLLLEQTLKVIYEQL